MSNQLGFEVSNFSLKLFNESLHLFWRAHDILCRLVLDLLGALSEVKSLN